MKSPKLTESEKRTILGDPPVEHSTPSAVCTCGCRTDSESRCVSPRETHSLESLITACLLDHRDQFTTAVPEDRLHIAQEIAAEIVDLFVVPHVVPPLGGSAKHPPKGGTTCHPVSELIAGETLGPSHAMYPVE